MSVQKNKQNYLIKELKHGEALFNENNNSRLLRLNLNELDESNNANEHQQKHYEKYHKQQDEDIRNRFITDQQPQNNKNDLTNSDNQQDVSSINENFAKTHLKPTLFHDKDIETLSELSSRSLASTASLLDRAKGNRDKYWGGEEPQVTRKFNNNKKKVNN